MDAEDQRERELQTLVDSSRHSPLSENTDSIPNTDPDPASLITSSIPTPPRRVKLYHLTDDSWCDKGTGFCRGTLEPSPRFYVVNEQDPEDVLLDVPIKGSTQYQRQQDTLIVWTGEDGIDYALSFQEPEGCLEVCSFLIKIQREKIQPDISLVAVIQTAEGEITEMIAGPIPSLPIVNEENLSNILDVLTINQYRTRITNQILENDAQWVSDLIQLFRNCEREHKLSSLYCLNDIVKTFFFFLDADVYEVLVRKDIFQDVLGILEYDPDFSGSKMNWREYVKRKVHFKEVIKFNNDEIKDDIVKCFNITFLREVVLVGLDESVMKCLDTMRQNQESIAINFLESDPNFLDELFSVYESQEEENDKDNDEDSRDRKIDSVKLMKQFVVASKSLQAFQRTVFYTKLIDKGLMKMIEFAMLEKEVESRILVGEIIVIIIDSDIQVFKDSKNEVLMNLLINILINEKPAGLKTQAYQAIIAFVNPSKLLDSQDEFDRSDDVGISANNSVIAGDLIDEEFFTNFYNHSAMSLFQPIIDMIDCTRDHLEKLRNREDSLALEYVCELLSFVAKWHEIIHSRSFILEKHLLKGIGRIIECKVLKMQLRLSAIRCLRTIVLLNDEFYTRYIIENRILGQFMEVVAACNGKNNMVSSACMSVLDAVRENTSSRGESNYTLLAKHLAERHGDTLRANAVGADVWAAVHEHGDDHEHGDAEAVVAVGDRASPQREAGNSEDARDAEDAEDAGGLAAPATKRLRVE